MVEGTLIVAEGVVIDVSPHALYLHSNYVANIVVDCFHRFDETFTPTSASSNMHASASSIDQIEVSTSDTNAIAMLAHA